MITFDATPFEPLIVTLIRSQQNVPWGTGTWGTGHSRGSTDMPCLQPMGELYFREACMIRVQHYYTTGMLVILGTSVC